MDHQIPERGSLTARRASTTPFHQPDTALNVAECPACFAITRVEPDGLAEAFGRLVEPFLCEEGESKIQRHFIEAPFVARFDGGPADLLRLAVTPLLCQDAAEVNVTGGVSRRDLDRLLKPSGGPFIVAALFVQLSQFGQAVSLLVVGAEPDGDGQRVFRLVVAAEINQGSPKPIPDEKVKGLIAGALVEIPAAPGGSSVRRGWRERLPSLARIERAGFPLDPSRSRPPIRVR